MNRDQYIGGKEASKILGVHQQTLYRWEKNKLIETIRSPGGKRFYNVKKYLEENRNLDNENNNNGVNKRDIKVNKDNEEGIEDIGNDRINICYCRVSTLGQRDDLDRQIIYMKDQYPEYIIIKDIGSGINFNRKGLNKIIDLAIRGKVNKVVVSYKDRLCRFGYDLIERIIKE